MSPKRVRFSDCVEYSDERKSNVKNGKVGSNLRLPLNTLKLLMRKCKIKLTRCDDKTNADKKPIVKKEVVEYARHVKREIVEEDEDLCDDNDKPYETIEPAAMTFKKEDMKPIIGNLLKCLTTKPCQVKLVRYDQPKVKLEDHCPPANVSDCKPTIKLEDSLKPCHIILARCDTNSNLKFENSNTSSVPEIELGLEGQKRVIPLKAFRCELCGKCFLHNSGLMDHMRRHLGEKHHKCTYCSKSFVTKEELKIHCRKHTGERPFECPTCGKRFGYKNALTTHLLVHTGKQPLHRTCHFCKMRHWRTYFRIRIISTGEKVLVCVPCIKREQRKTS